jgi:hypothetical protein
MTIKHYTSKSDNFIQVDFYRRVNEFCLYGFVEKESLLINLSTIFGKLNIKKWQHRYDKITYQKT